jgi:hypothetical protein
MKKTDLSKVDLDAGVVLGCQNPVAGTALPVKNMMSEYLLRILTFLDKMEPLRP